MRSGEELPGSRSAPLLGFRLCGHAREPEDRSAEDSLASDRVTIPGGRNDRETTARDRRAPLFAVAAVVLSVFVVTACGGTGPGDASAADANAGQRAGGHEGTLAARMTTSAGVQGDKRDEADARADGAVTRPDGGAEARERRARADTVRGGARSGEARADKGSVAIAGSRGGAGGNAGEDGPQKVTLEITGHRGTALSGACSVGGTERSLNAKVPELYVFEPRGKRLKCELRAEGRGTLGILLTDGAGMRSEQRIAGGRSTVRFTYFNGGLSSSTSSVSESQTVTSSDGSSSESSP